MIKSKPIRLDEEFSRLLKQIKIDRIKMGSDFEPQSERRISKAIARAVSGDLMVYNTLVKSPLESDRKKRR